MERRKEHYIIVKLVLTFILKYARYIAYLKLCILDDKAEKTTNVDS